MLLQVWMNGCADERAAHGGGSLGQQSVRWAGDGDAYLSFIGC